MAAVFTEAQRAGLHALSEGTIDDQWIKGIRAGWKLLVKQTKKFKGRRSTAPAMEQSYLDAAADGSTAALQNVQRYIGRLRDDLLLNKGFWDLPSDAQGKKELSIIRRYKTKVIDELDAAEEAISDGLSYARTVKEAASKDGGIGGREGYMHQETYASQDRFNFTLNGFGERLDGIMTMADKAISGRLFRHLSKVLATSFKHVLDYPTKGSEKWRSKKRYVKKQVPLDWGEHEPPVVHLGKATVIFQDMPGEGAGGTISPRKVGSETTVKKGGEVVTTKEVTSRTKYGGGYMHPRDRKEFVDGLKEAQARLRAKRLGKLFHGGQQRSALRRGGRHSRDRAPLLLQEPDLPRSAQLRQVVQGCAGGVELRRHQPCRGLCRGLYPLRARARHDQGPDATVPAVHDRAQAEDGSNGRERGHEISGVHVL